MSEFNLENLKRDNLGFFWGFENGTQHSTICSSLLIRNANLSFWHRIVTGANPFFITCNNVNKKKKTVVTAKWVTSANTKAKIPYIEVLDLCLVEYEMCHLLQANETWKDHHYGHLMPASWPGKWSIMLKVFKQKRCYFPAYQCKVILNKPNIK